MALRKVEEFSNEKGDKATIYVDFVWQEVVVKFVYADIGYLPDCDYHCSDRQDARDTAKHTLGIV